MLNISAALQIKSSTGNPILTGNPELGNAREPATEEFSKVLKREVSGTGSKRETSASATTSNNKRETNSSATTSDSKRETSVSATTSGSSEKTTSPEDDDIASIATTDTSCTHNLISRLFFEATNSTYAADQLLPPFDPTNPNILMATPIIPMALSTSPQNSLIPQDSKLATSPAPFAGQMLQQKMAQATAAESNLAYALDDFWQSVGAADSAIDGKLLPFSSEMSDDIQATTGETIFSVSNESASTQPLGLSNTTTTTPLNTTPQNVQVDLPVGQPKWGNEFAQKIIWLTSQQNQVAEIHLNPAHLGPVEVMLSITQDQATAQFLSPHLAVREAIEAALPRLREMMAENGIQLGNVMVGAESFQQENKQQQTYSPTENTSHSASTKTEAIGQIETAVSSSRHSGMVNTYA